MRPRSSVLAAASLALASCGGSESDRGSGKPSPQPTVQPSPSPSTSPAQPGALDWGALDEREDPRRVLRFYAAALAARDWDAAQRAWGVGSGATATDLAAEFGGEDAPRLEVGEGRVEGAAGSLYFEAPVTLRLGAGEPLRRGTITLRRANDVPGATRDQLRWHLESASFDDGG